MNNIPKIFFSYWDGNLLSHLQYLTVVSFKDLNPDWKIIMYMPTEKHDAITWHTPEQKTKYEYKNYLNDLLNLDIEIIHIDFEDIGFYNNVSEVYKADYIRYYMLNKHGGMWSDMDIIYIESIDKVFNKQYLCLGDFDNVDTVISYFNGYYSIGLLMSSPNNDFFKNLTDNCNKCFNAARYQSIGSHMFKSLYPTPQNIKLKHPELNILVVDCYCYLPFRWNNVINIFVNNASRIIRPYTVGIHWFNGSNQSKQYQLLIDNGELSKVSTIYKYIEKYL